MFDQNDCEMVSMEEGKAGETSRKGKELSNEIVQIATGSSVISSYAKENLKLLDDVSRDEEDTKPRIPKVPDMLRNNQNLKMYFEPRLVSIGPYHHENKNLKVTQEMKVKLAAMFIKEHGMNKENVFLEIIKEIEDLKKCYEVDAIKCYRDDELAWMFLIDGCVVLHFICYRAQREGTKSVTNKMEIFRSKGLEIIEDITETLKFSMDLLLLENQLPYQVLRFLINSSKNSKKLMKSTQEFIAGVTYSGVQYQASLPLEDPPHLLHQIRTCLTHSVEKKSNFIAQILEKSIKIIDMLFYILLGLIAVLLRMLPYSPTLNLNLTSMHNIAELKEAGIQIKCSGTCYLTDISFSGGTLKLPSIRVNKLTTFKFLNLIAYEMCLNSPNNKFEVSAYIYFLSSLIVRTEDVKELLVKRILTHFFISDEDVVKLFKEISNYDMSEPFIENYLAIMEEMHDHCSKRYNAWKGQLKNKYFESPWSVVALVGAIIALVVTILQTVYTILAYYKERTV